MNKRTPLWPACLLGLTCLAGPGHAQPIKKGATHPGIVAVAPHVLLISVDGMHAIDLAIYIKAHPTSTLAQLAQHGTIYPNASTTHPSDSFPGMLSMVTGALPKDEGVYYDDSFDRSLLPPNNAAAMGLNYISLTTPGTECLYAEPIEFDFSLLNGGGGVNPDNLPRDPNTLQPVLPHNFGRLNTIFQVAHAAGLYTAWSDKHFAYDILNGPDAFGPGANDLYTPEINSSFIVVNGKPTDKSGSLPNGAVLSGSDGTTSLQNVEAYDSLKVQAIINEIDGLKSDGTTLTTPTVPAIFGMNFQTVSVGQKLNTEPAPNTGADADPLVGLPGGYTDAVGTPGPLLSNALDFVNVSLGKFVAELKNQGLSGSTTIIISAKHGQSPINKALLRKKAGTTSKITDPSGDAQLGSEGSANSSPTSLAAYVQTDDIALIWLRPTTSVASALSVLSANRVADALEGVLYGPGLKFQFGDPATDPRTPDMIAVPQPGVIYTSGSKIAEHGGFNKDDSNVAMLVSNPSRPATVNTNYVQTTQIAPTILKLLGLNPAQLQGVQKEGTPVLPGF